MDEFETGGVVFGLGDDAGAKPQTSRLSGVSKNAFMFLM